MTGSALRHNGKCGLGATGFASALRLDADLVRTAVPVAP